MATTTVDCTFWTDPIRSLEALFAGLPVAPPGPVPSAHSTTSSPPSKQEAALTLPKPSVVLLPGAAAPTVLTITATEVAIPPVAVTSQSVHVAAVQPVGGAPAGAALPVALSATPTASGPTTSGGPGGRTVVDGGVRPSAVPGGGHFATLHRSAVAGVGVTGGGDLVTHASALPLARPRIPSLPTAAGSASPSQNSPVVDSPGVSAAGREGGIQAPSTLPSVIARSRVSTPLSSVTPMAPAPTNSASATAGAGVSSPVPGLGVGRRSMDAGGLLQQLHPRMQLPSSQQPLLQPLQVQQQLTPSPAPSLVPTSAVAPVAAVVVTTLPIAATAKTSAASAGIGFAPPGPVGPEAPAAVVTLSSGRSQSSTQVQVPHPVAQRGSVTGHVPPTIPLLKFPSRAVDGEAEPSSHTVVLETQDMGAYTSTESDSDSDGTGYAERL